MPSFKRADAAKLMDDLEEALPPGSRVIMEQDGYTVVVAIPDPNEPGAFITTAACHPAKTWIEPHSKKEVTGEELMRSVAEVKKALRI